MTRHPPCVREDAIRVGDELEKLGFGLTLQYPGSRARLFPEALPLNRVSRRVHLQRKDYNLSILLQGTDVMVVDVDTAEGMRFAEVNGLISTMVVQTRRGVHSYMRHDIVNPSNRQNFRGLGIDLLFNAVVPVPPAWVKKTGHVYTWQAGPVPKTELPLFDKRLIQEEVRRTIVPLVSSTRESLVKYIGRIVAVSGEGGHRNAFRCACKIASQVEDVREALAIFLNWNETNARPPFSERECIHKIEDAYKKRRNP